LNDADLRINADFDQRVVIPPVTDYAWVPSPCPGVWRHRLDRIGGELARATSIVRYAPGSQFSEHTHGGGEEFLVLDGVFSDEHGDYPAGTYVRNPPGSKHTPFYPGRLHDLRQALAILSRRCPESRTRHQHSSWRPGLVPGLSVMPLHEFDGVNTALVTWKPHIRFNAHTHPGGEEILVLNGVFHDEYGEYPAGTWLRSPRWSKHTLSTGTDGALIYVKVGHLGAPMLEID
jgi:anti-sigma factor ChrR (cupin superfamily)